MVNERAHGHQSNSWKDMRRFFKSLSYHNAWAPGTLHGKFFKKIAPANAYVKQFKPQYGFLTLPVFLAWKKPYNLKAIGVATTQGNSQWIAASGQYHIISASESSLADCKRKRVISHFWKDSQFLNAVVGGADWNVREFDEFPLSASDDVLSSLVSVPPKADCALVDDAQLGDLKRLAGAEKLKTLWSSAQMPSVVVAQFPSASFEDQHAFKSSFEDVCANNGMLPCAAMGFTSLHVAEAANISALDDMFAKFSKPVALHDSAVAKQASDAEDEDEEEKAPVNIGETPPSDQETNHSS